MSDTLIVLHTAIAIIVIVLLIVVAKVDPVISLVIGTLYLGVAAGLGFEDTIGTFVQGFGDIMAEGPTHRLRGAYGHAAHCHGGSPETGRAAAEYSRPTETTLRVQRCPE